VIRSHDRARRRRTACLAACALAGCVTRTTRVATPHTTVVVTRPMIVGVFPRRRAEEGRGNEALAAAVDELEHALDAAKACVAGRGVVVQAVPTDLLVLEYDGQRLERPVPPEPEAVACYLAMPGKPPRLVGAGAPPSVPLVRQEAADYFGIPACRVEPDRPREAPPP
jgi:hypothetical protein